MATITLYYNTSFNLVDEPATAAVLAANSSSQVFTIETMNDAYQAARTVKINQMPSNLAGSTRYAYCDDSGAYYDVSDISWLNNTTVLLRLIINPFLTYPNATITGHAERLTTYSYNNLLPEPFSQSLPLEETAVSSALPDVASSGTTTFVLADRDLSSTPTYYNNILQPGAVLGQTTYNDSTQGVENLKGTELTVEINHTTDASPSTNGESRRISFKTTPKFNPPVNTAFVSEHLGGLGAYVYDAVKDNIATYNSYDIQPVKYIWTIPTAYERHAGSTSVSSINPQGTNVRITSNRPSDIHNTKAYELYRNISVKSKKSGEQKTYRWADIRHYVEGTGYVADINISAEISPLGFPYAYPAFYKDNSELGILMAVKGARWFSPGMTIEGKSGSLIGDYQTQIALRNAENTAMSGAVTGGVSAATDALTAYNSAKLGMSSPITAGSDGTVKSSPSLSLSPVSGLSKMTSSFADMTQNWIRGNGFQETDTINYQNAKADTIRNNIASKTFYNPSYMPADMTSGMTIANNFAITEENLSHTDMKALDTFLTMYGVSVDYHFAGKPGSLAGRYFCYIKLDSVENCSGMLISGAAEIAASRLKSGVRLWKTAVNYTNPITNGNGVD